MPFELQPTLLGELVTLRPLTEDDFDAIFAVASDPLVWQQHPDSDRYQPEVFKAYFRGAMDSGGAFAVLDTTSGKMIGSTRFYGYNEANSEIEIGWTFLARSHWGGNSNREMKRMMLLHAFQFVKTVVFIVGAQNMRSRRAVEKIGAVYVGSRLDGKGRESVVYQLTAEMALP